MPVPSDAPRRSEQSMLATFSLLRPAALSTERRPEMNHAAERVKTPPAGTTRLILLREKSGYSAFPGKRSDWNGSAYCTNAGCAPCNPSVRRWSAIRWVESPTRSPKPSPLLACHGVGTWTKVLMIFFSSRLKEVKASS